MPKQLTLTSPSAVSKKERIILPRNSEGEQPSPSRSVRLVLVTSIERLLITASANLEKDYESHISAPSMEDQQEKYRRNIEKTIIDRMGIMREVVVRTFTSHILYEFPDLPLHRKSRDALNPNSRR